MRLGFNDLGSDVVVLVLGSDVLSSNVLGFNFFGSGVFGL
jgi:hypothetical protein